MHDTFFTKKSLLRSALAALALGATPACVDPVPDLNNPGLESLETNPTRTTVDALGTGLVIGARTGIGAQNGYVGILGVIGREAYIFDSADPRYATELVTGALNPGNPAFGGNFWTNPYANIADGYLMLRVLDNPRFTGATAYTDVEKEAARGFTQTVMALDYLVVSNTHDTNGVALDVNRPLGSDLAPLVTDKAAQLAFIADLLDQAQAHLKAAGTNPIPFPVGPGFAGFDTADTFLKANRALKARVEAYRGNGQAVLDALSASFLPPATERAKLTRADLRTGIYHAFGTGPGDTGNGVATSKNVFVHPSIIESAQKKTNDDVDDRVSSKTRQVTATTYNELTSDHKFTVYTSADADIPIIRVEELLLLRAEGNALLGNWAEATADVNAVRTLAGGLAPLAAELTADSWKGVLLTERTYSLLLEGGHRWIDARRFGLLGTLPVRPATDKRKADVVPNAFPVPTPEMDARK